MTSKEIIKRVIAHDAPPRFGYAFLNNTDFKSVRNRQLINLPDNPYDTWGTYPELSELTGFRGETRRDHYGNIYGRFDGKTKGECIRGAIQDFEDYEFNFPDFDPNYREKLLEMKLAENEKFIITTGTAIFSVLRDARLISNALMDTIEAPKTLAEIGIDESLLPTVFQATKDIRDKYVLSRLAWDLGVMDELCQLL